MRISRPRAMVPWVPSRHRLALFRLIAFMRLARTPAKACTLSDTTVLAIDRDQSTFENVTVCMFIWLIVSTFFASVLASRMPLPVAVAVSVPIAALAVSAAIILVGLTAAPLLYVLGFPHGPNHLGLNSMVMIGAVALAASYFATTSGWVRFPAWLFLAAVAANGFAAMFLLLMRPRVRAAESRCVA